MHHQPKAASTSLASSGNVTGHVALVDRKRGAKWYMRYRLADGRKVQKCLGPAWKGKGRPPAGHYTTRTAEEALEATLTDARRGTLPGAVRSGATFGDACAEFLRYCEEVKKIDAATVADYRGVVNGYLLEEFGAETPAEAIDPDRIDTYKERLIAEGKLSNRTIVRHLTVLHGIFKRAKRVYKLRDNPATADLVERPTVVYTGEFHTLDGNEVERLVVAGECLRDAVMYRVAVGTGLRTGELLALHWDDVDFLGGLVHVKRTWDYKRKREKMPKGKRVRSVPMMPAVVDALAELKDASEFAADDDLVFCDDVGAHLDYYAHRRRYQDALKAAGLPSIRFHDLRHAFGSTIITSPEITPADVQGYMGHQHFSTTQRYLHHRPQPAHAAAFARAFARGDESPAPAEAVER
jgi:integrase